MINFHELEAMIEKEMAEHQVPGLAMAVVHNQELVYARGFGQTCVQNGSGVNPETLFRVGSLTKPMTAILILKLAAEGKVKLDELVTTYLPWFRLSDEESTRSLTLRHLLSHSSGLINQANHCGRRDPEGLRDYVRDVIPTLPVFFKPGLLFSYSNNHFNILGLIAEEVCGKPYGELMRERVFEPLGMTATTFDPLAAMTRSLALAHAKGAEGEVVPLAFFPENTANHPSFFAMSNVLDLAKMAQFFLAGGPLVEEMTIVWTPHRSVAPGVGAGLGIFRFTRKGHTIWSHFGDIASYSGDMVIAPEIGLAVIVLNNNEYPIYNIIYKVLDSLLEEKSAPSPEAPPEDLALLERLAGSYFGPMSGLNVLKAENGRLVLEEKGRTQVLERLREDLFVVRDEAGTPVVSVGFVPVADGDVEYITVNNNFAKRFEPSEAAYAPSAEELEAFAGTYSADGIVTSEIFVKDGQLFVTDDHGTAELIPFREGLFLHKHFGTFEFVRVEDGRAQQLNWSLFLEMKRVS